MITLPWLIAISTLWFLVLALLKSRLSWKFCAACAAISSSWIALLILRFVGILADPLFIGILMGESIVGLYYLLEKRFSEKWQIFRWPYLVTATSVVYFVIGVRQYMLSAFMLLIVIWIVFGIIYAMRNSPSFKKVAERLIACCKDW